MLRTAEVLAAWAPPELLPALPPAPKPERPSRPEKPLLRLAGGKGVYLEALKSDPCAYCGGPGGERDHIVPRAIAGGETGGKSTRDVGNLTGVCAACNQEKRDRDLLGFLLVRA